MATSRWSFTHEGRAFAFNLSTQVLVEEFVWRAEIWCDQMEVGQLAGRAGLHPYRPNRARSPCSAFDRFSERDFMLCADAAIEVSASASLRFSPSRIAVIMVLLSPRSVTASR